MPPFFFHTPAKSRGSYTAIARFIRLSAGVPVLVPLGGDPRAAGVPVLVPLGGDPRAGYLGSPPIDNP